MAHPQATVLVLEEALYALPGQRQTIEAFPGEIITIHGGWYLDKLIRQNFVTLDLDYVPEDLLAEADAADEAEGETTPEPTEKTPKPRGRPRSK